MPSPTSRRGLLLSGLGLLTLGLSGCQLLALPFQLAIALVSLAVKLVPLVPLFVYEPMEGAAEIQVATASEIDRALVEAQALDEDSLLPTLDSWVLERPLEAHRLAGLVLLPARDVRRGDEMQPLLDELREQGYVVQVGPLLDGASLLDQEDLLPRARFLTTAAQRGLLVAGGGEAGCLSTEAGVDSLALALGRIGPPGLPGEDR